MTILDKLVDRIVKRDCEDREYVNFQVHAAAYAWLSLNHGGQGSRQYALLCAIDFNPGPMWSETRELEENTFADEVSRFLTRRDSWAEGRPE